MRLNKSVVAAVLAALLLPGLVHAQGAQELTPGRVEAGARVTNRVGSATEAEAGAVAVLPLGAGQRAPGPATAVFGSALFTRDAAAVSDAPNPNYIITPGDRISIRVWGATEAEVNGQVDSAGMMFLPQIGPVRLAGTRAGDLQRTVETEVRRIYTQDVNVYAVLLSTQRIGVFVTGFVRTPGRFGGSAADSVIDFLVRAGGVDASRGSYRDIVVRRNGGNVATVDLYSFLIEGRLPALRLQEGDTIVVGRQRALVGADGAVRNNFLFEVPARIMTGRELVEYSRPLPAATNAVVQGSRNGRPFSRYVTLSELSSVSLSDQDTVSFITDSPSRTIRVMIEGSRIGPSVLVADRDTQLCSLLDYVAVDPALANTQGVFLLRQRVAAQQQRTMEEALDRLERQLFLATSPHHRCLPDPQRGGAAGRPVHPARPPHPARRAGGRDGFHRSLRACPAGGRRRDRHPRAQPDRAGQRRGERAARHPVAGKPVARRLYPPGGRAVAARQCFLPDDPARERRAGAGRQPAASPGR